MAANPRPFVYGRNSVGGIMDLGISNLAPRHSIQRPQPPKSKSDGQISARKRKQKAAEFRTVLKKQKKQKEDGAAVALFGGLRTWREWDKDRLVHIQRIDFWGMVAYISLELKVFVLVLKPILEMLVQTQKLIGEWILMTFLVG